MSIFSVRVSRVSRRSPPRLVLAGFAIAMGFFFLTSLLEVKIIPAWNVEVDISPRPNLLRTPQSPSEFSRTYRAGFDGGLTQFEGSVGHARTHAHARGNGKANSPKGRPESIDELAPTPSNPQVLFSTAPVVEPDPILDIDDSVAAPPPSRPDRVPLPTTVPTSGDDLCRICQCPSDPNILPFYPHRIAPDHLQPDSTKQKELYLRRKVLDIYCRRILMTTDVAKELLVGHRHTFAADISRSRRGLQTAYMFTKTGPGGRVAEWRTTYLNRHAEAIKTFMTDVAGNGYRDGTPAQERQLVWILVEDAAEIDSSVAKYMREESGVPFIYFAYGPTRNWGNGQLNAALQLISLLQGLFGAGPVFGIDDDTKVLPELFHMVWSLKRIGIWPIGNLGPTGWEFPVYDESGKIVEWAWSEYRDYPLDNNAFAFNSTLLVDGTIPGPRFWNTDYGGGESEFVGQIVNHRDQLEPLCMGCHVAWHNQWIIDL